MKKIISSNKYFIPAVIVIAITAMAITITFAVNQGRPAEMLGQGLETEQYQPTLLETANQELEQIANKEQEAEDQIHQPTLAELRATGEPLIFGRPHGDYIRFRDIEEMIDRAEYVVVGRFTAHTGSMNGAFVSMDPLIESPYNYVHTRLYNFQIDGVLKGNIDSDNITVGVHYFVQYRREHSNRVFDFELGKVVHEATEFDSVVVNVIDEYFLEPQIGQTVVLFLRYVEALGNFSIATNPMGIALLPDGTLAVRCPRIDNMFRDPNEHIQILHSELGHEIHLHAHSNCSAGVGFDFVSGMTVRDLLSEVGVNNSTVLNDLMHAAENSPPPVFPQQITVVNGGHLAHSQPGMAMPNQKVMISAGMPPEGYTFAGWTSNQGIVFADASAAQTTFAMIDRPATITANWQRDALTPVTITWNAMGGSVSPTTSQLIPGTQFGALPTPSKHQHTFTGWWTTAAGGGVQIRANSIVPNSYTTYFARWISWFENCEMCGAHAFESDGADGGYCHACGHFVSIYFREGEVVE